MVATPREVLRQRLQRESPLVAPGVFDALSARLVERAGFEAVFVSGAAVAASTLGVPDLGLATMSETLGQTANIVVSTSLPVIADCDTGYGNPLNVRRTISSYERAGVAALFIEDQTSPKRCGHFERKELISTAEMRQKLRAAVDARTDPSLLLIARTDAVAIEGLEGAVARGNAYVEAGAEMVFVEAPETLAQLDELPRRIAAPLMINLVEGGRTPLLPVSRLGEMGFRLITFSGTLQKAAILAIEHVLSLLAEDGDVRRVYPEFVSSLAHRSEILGLEGWRDLEARYTPKDGTA
jgi:2-methylisocitrate lyase-like PEP mutase family enzyme